MKLDRNQLNSKHQPCNTCEEICFAAIPDTEIKMTKLATSTKPMW